MVASNIARPPEEFARAILDELISSLERGNPSVGDLLESNGVTRGGEIHSEVELFVFALFPADAVLAHFEDNEQVNVARSYVRIFVAEMFRRAAKEAGALRGSDHSYEEWFKQKFHERFAEYTEAWRTASPDYAPAVAEKAMQAISSGSGTPIFEPTCERALAKYLEVQVSRYRDITLKWLATAGN